MCMDVTIVVNPNAGRQNFQKELDGLQQAFGENGVRASLVKTPSREEAGEIIRRAVEERPGALVCCGGDGTLSETVNHLLNAGGGVPLGYIPAGTTNDFANSLGIPKDVGKAAQRICAGGPKALDVGRFGYRYFIYVASFGAFTQSSYNTTQSLKSSLGHLAYIIEGIKELPTIKSYHVCVETAEGGVYEDDYIFGSVSNSMSLGGIIKLDSGKVDLADGKFELTLVKMPRNLIELNRIVFSLLGGKYDEELITFVHTEKAVFTCAEPMPWSLDGEYAAGGEKVEVEAVPQAIEMFY